MVPTIQVEKTLEVLLWYCLHPLYAKESRKNFHTVQCDASGNARRSSWLCESFTSLPDFVVLNQVHSCLEISDPPEWVRTRILLRPLWRGKPKISKLTHPNEHKSHSGVWHCQIDYLITDWLNLECWLLSTYTQKRFSFNLEDYFEVEMWNILFQFHITWPNFTFQTSLCATSRKKVQLNC